MLYLTNISCRSQVYKLVQDLHRIGVVHGDLEPRNIGRACGGRFYLLDFSESRSHVCKESEVCSMTISLSDLLMRENKVGTQVVSAKNQKCSKSCKHCETT